MLRRLLPALFLLPGVWWFGQDSLSELLAPSIEFHIAGHAYGSHHATNPALHPPLLEFIDNGGLTETPLLFFAGDFLRRCTPSAWQILWQQLETRQLQGLLVAGNHERAAHCRQWIAARRGATSYSVNLRNTPVLMLDTADPPHRLSGAQLKLVDAVLDQAISHGSRYVFLVTHHLLWLSDPAYAHVLANPGSRHPRMLNSNYWTELHPRLTARAPLQVVVVAGDVGGRPDSMADWYRQRDNVHLVATGMGEVADENLLRVRLKGSQLELAWRYLDGRPARQIRPAPGSPD